MIDLCICTHNPRREIFERVLASVENQTAAPSLFRVLVIDNASSPPIPEDSLSRLRRKGICARIVREPRTGTIFARLSAVSETSTPWLLFVDDDNELAANYVTEGIRFIEEHPEVGCFGGKLLLADYLDPPAWAWPFLPFLAIKDLGGEPVIGKIAEWQPCEPPGAGAFVHRKLLDEFRRYVESNPSAQRLGASAARGMAFGEDSLMMRCAIRFDLANGYNPRMALHHHLLPARFRLRHLIKMMYAYGVSQMVLESILKGSGIPHYYRSLPRFLSMLCFVAAKEIRKSAAFAIGMIAWHCGARRECLRQAGELNHGAAPEIAS